MMLAWGEFAPLDRADLFCVKVFLVKRAILKFSFCSNVSKTV